MKKQNFNNIEDAASYLRVLVKPIPEPPPLKRHHIFTPKLPEKVVGGDILRKPIDKTAAIVVSPAPWWFMPPDIKPVPPLAVPQKPRRNAKKKIRKPKMKTDTVTLTQNMKGSFNPSLREAVVEGEVAYDMNDFALKVIEEINKIPQKLTPLARAAIDAQGVLRESRKTLGEGLEDFNAQIKVGLEDMRRTRFAVVTEISQMLIPLKEIRQFFLGASYEQEISQLREFVELCERLSKLKESGFIDSIADTLIKLDK